MSASDASNVLETNGNETSEEEELNTYETRADTLDDDGTDDMADDDDMGDGAEGDGADMDAKETPLVAALRLWVAEFNISQSAVRALLSIVNSAYKGSVPMDPRTLMKTPRYVPTVQLADSAYWHQGVAICLRTKFRDLAEDMTIQLNVNVDGLPLFRSATKCFWPILLNVHGRSDITPMAAGVYYGESKPEDAEQFFRLFIDELKVVLAAGLCINGHKLTVILRCFIADTPARAFMKGFYRFMYIYP